MLLLLATAGVWLARRPALEPRYHGRRLTAWLADASYWMGVDDPRAPQRVAAARDALRQMGEDALPCLVTLLEREDSRVRSRVTGWLERGAQRYFAGLHAYELRSQAVWAFGVLGVAARPALPQLEAMFLDDRPNRPFGNEVDVALALAGIGAESVPALARGLRHPDRSVRFAALQALEDLGARYPASSSASAARELRRLLTETAVPLLIRMVEGDDPLRGPAAQLLGRLRLDAEHSVPALIRLGEKSPGHPVLRAIALGALAEFGPAARAALPLWASAAEDPDPAVRAAARRGLQAANASSAAASDGLLPKATTPGGAQQ